MELQPVPVNRNKGRKYNPDKDEPVELEPQEIVSERYAVLNQQLAVEKIKRDNLKYRR